MHREDTSCFVLYIEPRPEEKSAEPVDDELTRKVEHAMSKAKEGAAHYSDLENGFNGEHDFVDSGWRGMHRTACGEWSDNHDYLLPNGLITNSLAVFYVRWYRSAIPACDLAKLATL